MKQINSWPKEKMNLTEAEKYFRLFFDNVSDGIILAGVKTKKFHYGNRAICRMLGVSAAEFVKMGIADIHPREALPKIYREFRLMAEGKMSLDQNVPVKGKNGEILYVDISTSVPIKLDAREYIFGVFHDISGRHHREERVRETERELQNLIDNLPDATFALNLKGEVIAWNKNMEKITDLTKSQVKKAGKYAYALPFYKKRRPVLANYILEGKEKEIKRKYPKVKKSGEKYTAEILFSHLNRGRGINLALSASPFFDRNGKLVGAIEVLKDITREAKERSGMRLRGEIIENLAEGVIMTGAESGKIIFTNSRFDRMFGYKKGELVDQSMAVLSAPGVP
jgi:PAS domain S-box-containing protein